MNKKQWERIKQIKPDRGLVVVRGRTHDIGRNKAKALARASGSRHIGKAPRIKGA